MVQDSLVEAIKQWTYKGIPANPSGWLFTVAKNRALKIINREKYQKQYTTDVVHLLGSEWTAHPTMDHLFSESEISDDQLRMMFTCCHPAVSPDSQIALILKTLCGFSITEIAKAFMTSHENIDKRLVRARQKIRESGILFEVPAGKALAARLRTVLEAVYLLYNEGYSASVGLELIRYEICEEAIRLAELIAVHPTIEDKSDVYALLALMQLNTSRLKARQNRDGNILTLAQQDRSAWDFRLIEKGFANLTQSITEKEISVYHILASISFYHCTASRFEDTDWKSILFLYNKLMQVDASPVVMLNRAVALAKVEGPEAAITELGKLNRQTTLISYHLLYSVQAEFYMELGRYCEAAEMLKTAIECTPLPAEKGFLQRKLEQCEKIFS